MLRDPPYLQVAIDVTDLSRAVKIAEAVAISEKVILEAGTPLIKSAGINSVRILSQLFPENIVFADMKTMDVGALEAELAISAGAKITSVLGAADDKTIAEAAKRANELGGEVQVDMISIPEPRKRAKEVLLLGAGIIGLHAGIDQQIGRMMRGVDYVPLIRSLKDELHEVKISVAGGIKPEDVEVLVNAGADVIVAGSSITGSRDPREKAREFLQKIG